MAIVVRLGPLPLQRRRVTRVTELERIFGTVIDLIEVLTVAELVTAVGAPDVIAVALDAPASSQSSGYRGGVPPSRRYRPPALLMALAVLAAACSSSKPKAATVTTTTSTVSPATTTLPPVLPASWHACTAAEGPSSAHRQAGAGECATIQVPLDYSNPTGKKIGLALARRPATGTKTGSLLINPGGPGASGVDSLDYISSQFSDEMLAHFDVVAFDPRGVKRSSPVLCIGGAQIDQFVDMNPAPTTAAGFDALVAASRTFDQGCQAMSGEILPFLGTVNAARDMDQIRSAVGDPKLSYLGFSYGTFLGATYAELFPDHIRAMVLDGATNPALDPVAAVIDQAAGFDHQLAAFFAFCSTTPTCGWQPSGDLHAAYDALIAKIVAHPLPGSGKRTLGPGEAYFGVAVTLYDEATWPVLAQALQQASNGNGATLLSLSDQYTDRHADGTYSNQLEANNAINCVDSSWPRDPAAIQQAAVTAKQKAPEFGVADLYGGLTCALWPVPATSKPHAIKAAGSPPIVVVGTTGDPATPYADAQALAGQLEHGVLLTREGNGHTAYRSSGCIRSHVDAYLLNGTVPAAGLTCPTP